MTLFDDIFVPLAKELIDEAGKVVTFTEPQVDGNYNPKTGQVEPTTTVTHPGQKISPPSSNVRRWTDGTLLEEGQAICLVYTQGNSMVAQSNWIDKSGKGWLVDIDGITWAVVEGKAIYSGELIAAWKLKIEK